MSALSNAVVVGSCLVSFSQSVRFQDQQDIQDCLLYAELAANDKYPEQVSEKVWFDYYQGRLLKAGFTLRVIVPSTPFRASNADQLLSINHTVVGKLGYERLGQLIDDTYRALKLDNIAWEFFQGNVARDGLGILKTAPCERLDSGETVVCLFGIRYSTVVIKPELFWTDSGKEVVVIPDGGVFAFDRVQFLQYRARVHEKIDAYSDKALVRKLKL
ncbi:hypothetical protein OH720_02860 [Pseudomonas sp. WJP1]|uniref:hypothetical protein n=1 Tax=Pseudomonas sp. WJP1 TaxID=2986947 RepID=UPI00234B79A5|nr:hypothetical protein [Pseudomonas sp. WJP1]WCM51979.1 hypothetical protein OH720_02860 [Pseudomonas sp. WJP1]